MSKFIHILLGCNGIPAYSEDIEHDVNFLDTLAQRIFPGMGIHAAHCDGELYTFQSDQRIALPLLDSVSILLDGKDDEFASYFQSSPDELERFLKSYPKDPATNRRNCIALYIPLELDFWDVYKRVLEDKTVFTHPAWVFSDAAVQHMTPYAVEDNAKDVWDKCVSFDDRQVLGEMRKKGFSDENIIQAYRALQSSPKK